MELVSTARETSFSEAVSFSMARLGVSGISLKEKQLSAMKAIYEGRDVFVCLPTGYGKSLCYQTLPFLMEHKLDGDRAIIIVSPLVALMEDQVVGLKKHGVRASILSSSTSVSKDNIATGECLCRDNLFFCAPEAVTSAKWRDVLESEQFSSRIVAIAVDEAHCVSKW